MSVWTHVNGSIRVDSIRMLGKPDFSKIFIKSLWENTNTNCNMPEGSEGSLDFRIIENPNKDSLAAYTVSIFGDIRDYSKERLQDIKDWFERVIKECGMIRQAILQIDFEDCDKVYILSWQNDNINEMSYQKE